MTTHSVRHRERKLAPESAGWCNRCAKGWVYEPDEKTGEDWAAPCWMYLEGKTIEAGVR